MVSLSNHGFSEVPSVLGRPEGLHYTGVDNALAGHPGDGSAARFVTVPELSRCRRYVRELGGVGHDVDRLDPSLTDVERQHGVRLPVEITHDRGLSVDLGNALDPVPRDDLPETTDDAASDPLRAVQQVRDRDRLAAAI